MNRLYIRAHEDQAEADDKENYSVFALMDQFEWLLLSSTADVLSSGVNKNAEQLQALLKQQSLSYNELVFLPPEHRVQVRRVELAKGQHRHAEQVIPFLLEESLAQSPDELHYTVLNKSNKENVWVSIVAKEVMLAWTESLQKMGSVSCLPLTGQHYLPKREKYNLCCDQSDVPDFRHLAPAFELVSPWSDQGTNNQGKHQSWLFIVASRIQSNAQFLLSNVCHGEYGRQTQFLSQLKPWLWVATFALFSFATELYLTMKETQALNLEADKIYQTTSESFLKLAPDEGRVSYLERQIKGRIQRAKQGASELNRSLSVYEVMALVDQVRATVVGDHRITKLDYANKEYRLDWQASQRELLDSIQAELEQQPFQVVFEQVAKRGDFYVASIKLKEEPN